jgi:ribosomal-protein-alanine N-acetyltransferase
VAADEPEFVRLMTASRSLHRPWLPTIDDVGFDQYMARSERNDVEALLICRRHDSEMAGFLNLSQIAYGTFCNAACGYAAFAPSAGQGYLTEGVRLALRYAFTKLRLHRVEANIQPGNERSLALARRCGFTYEGFSPRFLKITGRWRDHERWAMTVEDWRGKPRAVRS